MNQLTIIEQNNQSLLFEGKHQVMILTKSDVTFEFKGDFLIRAKDVAFILEYLRTEEVTKFCKKGQVFIVKNQHVSVSAINRIQKLNNAGESFITNLALNRVLGKSEKPKAEPFQDWLYEDILPSINKHGAYLTPEKMEEALLNPDTLIRLATQLKQEREEKRLLEEEKARQQEDLEYKGGVIIGLVDEIDLAEKRQTLNRIMKKKGKQFENRWNELYKQFEMKYHFRLTYQFEKYNETHKPKMKSKVEYVEKVMGKLLELYEMACKLYVNDVDKLVREMYGINN